MTRPRITIVIARAQNGAIGRDGGLPWHISEDLRRFKRLTMGSAMIMGRRTFDSLPGLLPGRRHIVLTRNRGCSVQGVEVVHDMDQALAAADNEPLSVIGGAELFNLFLPLADRIELTEVLAKVDGDTFIDDPRALGCWDEIAREDHPATGDQPAFRFVTLERT